MMERHKKIFRVESSFTHIFSYINYSILNVLYLWLTWCHIKYSILHQISLRMKQKLAKQTPTFSMCITNSMASNFRTQIQSKYFVELLYIYYLNDNSTWHGGNMRKSVTGKMVWREAYIQGSSCYVLCLRSQFTDRGSYLNVLFEYLCIFTVFSIISISCKMFTMALFHMLSCVWIFQNLLWELWYYLQH